MRDILVKLNKAAFVKQEGNPFACRKLAFRMLGLNLVIAAAALGRLFHRGKSFNFFFMHKDVNKASKSLYKFIISSIVINSLKVLQNMAEALVDDVLSL